MTSIQIGSVSIENILIFIFLVFAVAGVSNIIYLLFISLLNKKFPESVTRVVARVFQYLILFAGLYYGIYDILGLDLTALGASLGIISIAIAFSSQQIIQNMIAGILIALQRPIMISDWVEIGSSGIAKVRDITLMRTVLRDNSGRLVYIPNSIVLSSNIINYTRSGLIQVSIPVTLDLKNFDLEVIKTVINDAALGLQKILPNMSIDEKTKITELFNLPHIKWLYQSNFDKNMFLPKMQITGISNNKVNLNAIIWIRGIENKDQIVSDFFLILAKKFDKAKMKML